MSTRPQPHTPHGDAQSSPSLAIVIPTFNEAENLPVLAERIFKLDMPEPKIIVVDDGSPDGTGEVANSLKERYAGRIEVIQRGSKQGLGTAYVVGFSRALEDGFDYVMQMDADLSHLPEYLPKFLKKLDEVDVVVGSRYTKDGGTDKSWSLPRKMLSAFGNFGIRTITGLRVKDATSGFKAFRREVLESLDLKSFKCQGFGFQAEVAHACQIRDYRVFEHPIIFDSRAAGYSKMSMAIVVEALWRLLLLRWRSR